MKSLRAKAAFACAVAVSAAGVAAAAAAAAPPPIERSTVERQFDDWFVCNGFNIAGEFVVQRTRMWFYDAEGSLLRFVIHRDVEGTVTNSATGVAFPYREHDTLTFYADGRVANTGEAAHIVVPGEGTIVLISGLLTDDEVHGRFDEPHVCEALS